MDPICRAGSTTVDIGIVELENLQSSDIADIKRINTLPARERLWGEIAPMDRPVGTRPPRA